MNNLATAKAIDAALEKVYREVLRKMWAASIKRNEVRSTDADQGLRPHGLLGRG